MTIYEWPEGKIIGEIEPSSIWNLKGPSYVHLDKPYRKKLGLTNHDEFFDTLKDAHEWLIERFPCALVTGYKIDPYDGKFKTIYDLIGD